MTCLTRLFGLLCLCALLGCGPDPRYVPNVGHPPILQQVNSVAKARVFFTGTTRAFQQPGSNEVVAQYFAPGGQVFSAIAGDSTMRLGAWGVEKKRRRYPNLCLSGADTPGTGLCISAVDLLSDGPGGAGLYRGDVFGLAQSEVPPALSGLPAGTRLETLMLIAGRGAGGVPRLSIRQ